MNIQEKSNWTNKNIEYLKNVNIAEYDLESGGLSVIKEFNLLDKKRIDELSKMEKIKKNIIIGKLQAKIPTLAKNMVVGFGKARQLFVNINQIPDENILSIKKDALFLINCSNINGRVTENLNFRQKNTYSSFIRLNNREFLYDPISGTVDIKGISDENIEKSNELVLAITRFLKQSEKIDKNILYENLSTFRSDYLNRKLSFGIYRNFDTGMFRVNDFEIENVDESFIDNIDISYNYIYYILPLIKLLLS